MVNFPRQKLSDAEKNEDWYKSNLKFAESVLNSSSNLRQSFRNKRINYNLAENIIDITDFEKIINPDQIDLTSLPATFQHIGIENNKINLLIGEYIRRKHDFKAYLSSSDQDGISRKESALMDIVNDRLTTLIKSTTLDPRTLQKELEKVYEEAISYQDNAEIIANKILKKELKQQDADFIFSRTFEDLLRVGEQIMYCGVLGGEPVIRRVNPENFFTIGGSSDRIEDSDILIEYGYQSIGKVIDDYYDELLF